MEKENTIDSLTKEQVAVFNKMSNTIRNIQTLNYKSKLNPTHWTMILLVLLTLRTLRGNCQKFIHVYPKLCIKKFSLCNASQTLAFNKKRII